MAVRNLSVSEPTIRVATDSEYAQFFPEDVLADYTILIHLRFDPTKRNLNLLDGYEPRADQLRGIIERVGRAFQDVWNETKSIQPFHYQDPETEYTVALIFESSRSEAEVSVTEAPAEELDHAPPVEKRDPDRRIAAANAAACCVLL